MMPERFAISSERCQDALSPLDENFAGFCIDGGTGSRVPLVNCVAQKIIVKVLPKLLAGFAIEASNSFLHVRPFADITHDVKFAIRNDGRGLPGKIGDPES